MIAERLHHFGICKFQQARTLFNQSDAHAQRSKHAGVLDADHTAAHNNQRLGYFRHAQNLIAVDNVAAVEGNECRLRGLRACADDHVRRFVVRLILRAYYVNAVRVREACNAGKHLDPIARELRPDHIDFCLDHVLRAKGQIGHRDLFLHAIIHSVDALIVEAGKVQHRFANGFAGDRPRIDGRATNDRGATAVRVATVMRDGSVAVHDNNVLDGHAELVASNLGKAGFLSLAVGRRAGDDSDFPGHFDAYTAPFPAASRHHLRGTERADFDVGREADAKKLAGLPGRVPLPGQLVPV